MIGSIGPSDFSHYRRHENIDDLYHGLLVVCMSRKHNGMYHALMGTADRCGYSGQQKGTICDARGRYPSI